ncbi:hypothetical protein C5E10_13805 [Pseudoclavibacter sp. RFBG4]|uniref:hypothetical protein n=1 Tax=Pseudoclavibacter sp. RFBG4 TaxID=2080575 RepID=UPI000CE86878|nr:hypothetical protein [Pseudoclavibacter sp. RFBG4]PPG28652.1 hypothetical protein C5E10_13805 [Pseudoclavibacter sp. RFBG4]
MLGFVAGVAISLIGLLAWSTISDDRGYGDPTIDELAALNAGIPWALDTEIHVYDEGLNDADSYASRYWVSGDWELEHLNELLSAWNAQKNSQSVPIKFCIFDADGDEELATFGHLPDLPCGPSVAPSLREG